MSAMLEVKDLVVSYGQIKAVKGISFTVDQGEVVCLIGTNGAGKTTTLRTISGLIRPTAGSITFEGKQIDAMPAHEIVTLGLAHSPEGRRIFPRMSVEENLLLGAYTRKDGELKGDLDAAYELFPILGERRAQPAGTFSGGEQQMLAMGRAMMSRPRLLLLDEPSMGLSPLMMKKIMQTVRTLRSQGTTILLVEQNAQAALSLADQGYVLEVGSIVLSGTGRELLASDEVRKAYLGEDARRAPGTDGAGRPSSSAALRWPGRGERPGQLGRIDTVGLTTISLRRLAAMKHSRWPTSLR